MAKTGETEELSSTQKCSNIENLKTPAEIPL